MLVIVKSAKVFRKPKYQPVLHYPCWGVYDTEKKSTVCKNVTHSEAQKYIRENG